MNYKIVTETEETESRYQNTPVMILENLPFYQKKVLDMCEYYANSKYLLGNKDELNREKPFYNVVNFRVTLAKVATDLDTKDVNITGDSPKDWVRSMLLQHESYEWMKEADFSYFLNKAGYTRAKYGGVLVKKCMEEGELEIEVVDWRNVVTDQIDILGGTIIETHYMTPVELMEKDGTWDDVRAAIKEATKKQGQSSAYGQEEYNSERIEVKEVHGQFPLSFMKEWNGEDASDEDDYIYKRMVFFYSKIGGECFYFFADFEKESPYKYLPWEEMPGRALGRGVIEDSEEAQIWINDSVINEKNAMDLAGKVVLKTNSKKLGNNILEVDNGKIFELEDGKDINSMNLTPAALGQFQNQIDKWMQQSDRATSSFDANTGEQPPAGTPYSQTALLNQVASKPFDYRREEMGIFISEIFEDWVIPYLIKKLYKKHILASDYSDEELEVIDNSFAVKNSNKALVKELLSMDMSQPMPTSMDQMAMIQNEKNKLSGVKRHIEIPEGYFDDFETKVSVVTTNEAKDKAAILQSLNTIMTTAMSSYNPQTGTFAVLENPTMAKIFGTIVETASAGLSPISLGIGKSQKSVAMPAQPQAPQSPVAPAVA